MPVLTKALIEKISQNQTECIICSVRIQDEHATWNCVQCYQMMHLRCINKWIKNLNINEKQKEPRKKHEDYVWSCPTCQYVYSENMPDYKCFCQGQREPEQEIGVLPHSCGQKEHYRYINDTKACQHKCTLQCHPGQCPPCNAALKY